MTEIPKDYTTVCTTKLYRQNNGCGDNKNNSNCNNDNDNNNNRRKRTNHLSVMSAVLDTLP